VKTDSNPIIPLEAAREYVRRGWRVVPIPFKRKAAVIDDWSHLTLTEADLPTYFDRPPQGLRILSLGDLQEESPQDVVVPSGGLAFADQAAFSLSVLVQNHERELPQHRRNLRAVSLPNAARILCKSDTQHPVQLVLDRPVAANGLGQTLYFHGEAAEIELNFLLLRALHDTTADDHAEAAEVLPAFGTRQILRHDHLIMAHSVFRGGLGEVDETG